MRSEIQLEPNLSQSYRSFKTAIAAHRPKIEPYCRVATEAEQPYGEGMQDVTSRMDFRHLRRETRTALELAIVELAPTELIEKLAVVTGLLEALSELPSDSEPALALGPSTAERATIALEHWKSWFSARRRLA